MNATRGLVAAAVVIIASAGNALPCLAQEPPEMQTWRIPGWSFTPSVSVGVLFDSNVALADPRFDLGTTQGDAMLTVEPSGQLEYLGRTSEFSASYGGNMQRYFDIEGLDAFSQRARVSWRHSPTNRLSLYVRDSYSDSPTTDEVQLNGVPFRRAGSRTNTLAGGVGARLTRTLATEARYDLTWVRFDGDDPFLRGGWIHAVRGDLTHQQTSRLSFGGEYGFRIAEMDEGTREMNFQDVGGLVRYQLGAGTHWAAAGGFSLLNDKAADESRTGPYFRTEISHQLTRATIGAGFQRQFVPSFGFGGSTSSQEVGAWIQTPFVRGRVFLNGSFSWRRSTPFREEALQLDTLWLRSSIGWAARRWARLEALYTFTQQDSIVTGGEVDRHRVGAQVVISQPVRIR